MKKIVEALIYLVNLFLKIIFKPNISFTLKKGPILIRQTVMIPSGAWE